MDDYIKRSDALRPFVFASDGTKYLLFDCDNFPVQIHLKDVQRTLRKIPAADVRENVRGEWEPTDELPFDEAGTFFCSVCHKPYDTENGTWDLPYFCPQCGADMRKETDG